MSFRLHRFLTVAARLGLCLSPGLALAQPAPENRQIGREWSQKMGRGEGKLQPGDPAPDFDLPQPRAQTAIRLSQFRGRQPVALVFASYT